jgi:hypothetical protein
MIALLVEWILQEVSLAKNRTNQDSLPCLIGNDDK